MEINENNFEEHFLDIRKNKPRKNDVIACFTAIAEFVDGMEKRNIVAMLQHTAGKCEAMAQVMRKCCQATEQDAYRVLKEMAQDLASGMTEEDVIQKSYKYTFRTTYYTKRENVPTDDPHWSIIEIKNLDEFLEKTQDVEGNEIEIKLKIMNEEN